jgi:hypothetical protein
MVSRIETVPCIEKADGKSSHRYFKRRKNRAERRRAKSNPECTPSYGKFRGWEM